MADLAATYQAEVEAMKAQIAALSTANAAAEQRCADAEMMALEFAAAPGPPPGPMRFPGSQPQPHGAAPGAYPPVQQMTLPNLPPPSMPPPAYQASAAF